MACVALDDHRRRGWARPLGGGRPYFISAKYLTDLLCGMTFAVCPKSAGLQRTVAAAAFFFSTAGRYLCIPALAHGFA
jgi:hypothetical protein